VQRRHPIINYYQDVIANYFTKLLMGAMDRNELIDRLASLPLFASVPHKDLEWVATRGEVQTYLPATTVRRVGEPVEEMMILLSGRIAAYAVRGGGWRMIGEFKAGEVMGIVPYSRMRKAPANLVAEDDAIAVSLHRTHFPDLTRDCPNMTTALVHHMLDRAREFRTVQLNDDRLQSLSRFASGLAHELNNPAAAAARSARSLSFLLDEAERASRALAAARLSDAQLEAIDATLAKCRGSLQTRSVLELADREDDISDWLVRNNIDPALADALAAKDVSISDLDQLAIAIPPDPLARAIRWIALGSEAREAARQIESATERIHELVSAVKGFTFMDRVGIPEEVDIERGLADTIAVLDRKSRAKSVEVRLETSADVPRVHGFGSEINQVWEKLIDNAIDASAADGKVIITVTSREDSVIVKVTDNGPGIPEENRARVFDPFFTTKPVGQGTGLGLDIARRIVHLHHGDIDLKTQPGKTVFRVRLPITGVRNMRADPQGG
jgi:signal transduction histidine kinase